MESPGLTFEEIDAGITAFLEAYEKMKKADILFCLDCTGSMKDVIEAVKDIIADFFEAITGSGIFVRLGLIEFRDRLHGEEHKVHDFNGQIFTKEVEWFKNELSMLKAEGGWDEPESSLDAIVLACAQPFGYDAAKVIVLITDAPPHIPDKDIKSVKEAEERIEDTGIDLFYCIINMSDERSGVYFIPAAGRGAVYDLGNGSADVSYSFRRMQISLINRLSKNLC